MYCIVDLVLDWFDLVWIGLFCLVLFIGFIQLCCLFSIWIIEYIVVYLHVGLFCIALYNIVL